MFHIHIPSHTQSTILLSTLFPGIIRITSRLLCVVFGLGGDWQSDCTYAAVVCCCCSCCVAVDATEVASGFFSLMASQGQRFCSSMRYLGWLMA